jgi:hypothetical protein
MLRRAQDLKGYELGALDGHIGKVKEFYFDDQSWAVRYLVADTGAWLSGKQVLISPYALEPALQEDKILPVELTKNQIESSPSLDADKPVSRQFESQYHSYYGWPAYWDGPKVWGADDYPERRKGRWTETSSRAGYDDPHLRSSANVTGHAIKAVDGEIGHVEDFVVDDETWVIRYLIVDTQNWWPGKKVLISTLWIEGISWEASTVSLNLTRETIKQSPEYTEEALLTRDYEEKLYRHYNREGYWAIEVIHTSGR